MTQPMQEPQKERGPQKERKVIHREGAQPETDAAPIRTDFDVPGRITAFVAMPFAKELTGPHRELPCLYSRGERPSQRDSANATVIS